MKIHLLATMLVIVSTPALAAGSHEGGHGHDEVQTDGHAHEMAAGQPGNPENVSRTIKITMLETDDGDMLFEPSRLSVAAGETVRFELVNVGELEHEFVLDDHTGLMHHKAEMENMGDMEGMDHDDPNAVSLEPGESGELVWKFANAGEFEYGCLIPGHYELGMKGRIEAGEISKTN